MRRSEWRVRAAMVAGLVTSLAVVAMPSAAQQTPGSGSADELPEKVGGSSNVHLVAHVPLGGFGGVADADIEQELSRYGREILIMQSNGGIMSAAHARRFPVRMIVPTCSPRSAEVSRPGTRP